MLKAGASTIGGQEALHNSHEVTINLTSHNSTYGQSIALLCSTIRRPCYN